MRPSSEKFGKKKCCLLHFQLPLKSFMNLKKEIESYRVPRGTAQCIAPNGSLYKDASGLQIYGGPGSLSHDFKIWPITFQGSGPSGTDLFSCEKISL